MKTLMIMFLSIVEVQAQSTNVLLKSYSTDTQVNESGGELLKACYLQNRLDILPIDCYGWLETQKSHLSAIEYAKKLEVLESICLLRSQSDHYSIQQIQKLPQNSRCFSKLYNKTLDTEYKKQERLSQLAPSWFGF